MSQVKPYNIINADICSIDYAIFVNLFIFLVCMYECINIAKSKFVTTSLI